ncbi:MAG: type II toxin-antitoxin system HicB family antitoxin [Proteobacteria bacterium]|nr:type II toxin-antitoxin system HicB family antitoxin [Pseudomonadota bacterium]
MTALTVRLPHSLHAKTRELAARDGVSVNQFIASAAGEKLASVLTVDYLRQEAKLGLREDFDRFMRAVPDQPDEADRG